MLEDTGSTLNKKHGFFRRTSEAFRYVFKANRYDNARNDIRGMWKYSDSQSFDQAANHWTRETLRSRARYTVINNAFAARAVDMISSALVGASPRLQLASSSIPDDKLNKIEEDWARWAAEIRLSEKLKQMIFARVVDGESFAQFCLNRRLRNAVKLDLMLFDADRVTSDALQTAPNMWTDGVKLDSVGAPVSYRVRKQHPSEALTSEAVEIPAQRVVHLFKRQFPEQHRGVTELQPALELFQLLDRYSKATVLAAERAADMAMVFSTDQYEDFTGLGESASAEAELRKKPFLETNWSRGTTVTLPEGWKASQIKAEQPVSTYSVFVSSLLNQIGAAVGVPKILLQASAENSNYSSARLDIQTFNSKIRIEREQLISVVLEPLFRLWLRQYVETTKEELDVSAQFYFDQFVQIDPQKEASAAETRLNNKISNLSLEYSRLGLDWQEQLNQIAREKKEMERLGILETFNNGNQRTGDPGSLGNQD